jgi:asparagine synthase (glutamine-hydrolysing)
MSLDFRLRRTFMGLSYDKRWRLPVWMSAIEPKDMQEFFANPLCEEELYEDAIAVWNDNETGSDIDRAIEFFTRIYLPDDILFKSDRASMMHGLEVRAVFLDNDIVDFSRRLPHKFKLRNGVRKWLLKKAVCNRIPQRLIERKKKGFGIPLTAWLKDMPIPKNQTAHIMSEKEITKRWSQHKAGQIDARYLLFCWLSLQEAMAR